MTAGVAALLRPRVVVARRAVVSRPARAAVVAGLVGLLWAAIHLGATHVLGWATALGDLGPVLAERLLVLVLLGVVGILLVSATVTALGAFYLADDVAALVAAPVPLHRLHHARLVDTVLASSWMVLLVVVPILTAFATTFHAGAAFWAAAAVAVPALLVATVEVGVLLATALVLAAPARGARDAVAVASGLALTAAVVAVRVLGPSKPLDASGLVGVAAYLARAGAPGAWWLPSTWAADVLAPLLGLRDGSPAFALALLVSTALMLVLVGATVVERVFPAAYTRAQTGRPSGGRGRTLGRRLARCTRALPHPSGLLLAKDLTVFLRDASQWSQLVLLAALVLVYLYNFGALPLGVDDGPLALAMRDLAVVLNLGLGAFVATAVAVRFVYPMPSLEGRAWWVVRTAPVPLARIWASKFWTGLLPLATLGLALVAATNALLGAPAVVTAMVLPILALLLAAVVALGLAFGARHARVDGRTAAEIATGFGAVAYMLACLALIAAVVALAAWPVERALLAARGLAVAPAPLADAALLAAAALLPAAALVAGRRVGLRALARLPV